MLLGGFALSFYSYKNQGNERCPGRIDPEALCKCLERVCIQVNKVYDSCLQQETMTDVQITLKDVDGIPFIPPLTFTGCRSTSTKGILKDTTITRLEDRPNFARVRTKVHIPVEITFEDVNGKKGTARGFVVVPKDVILYVPNESVIPFHLESIVSAICVSGEFVKCDPLTVVVDICITIILKIVAKVELLIPAYGFCEIPPCEEFSDNVCDEFFRLPLFPPQLEDVIEEGCPGRIFTGETE